MIETDALRQPYEVDDLDAAGVLGELDNAEVEDRVAARRKFRLVHRWAQLNPGGPESMATWGDGERGPARGCDDPIGGEGSPLVAAPAVPRLGAAMGIALGTALAWLADVIDVVHRLPLIHARVEALEVPTWKARRVALMTRSLSAVAAAWVDAQVAPRLHEIGFTTIGKIIDTAIAVFHPDRLDPPDASAKGRWGVRLDHGTGANGGNSWFEACGDTLDLIDLHDLVCRIAEALRLEGDEDTLDQRKAKALGLIGRGDYQDLLDRRPAKTGSTQPRRLGAPTKVYVHVHANDLHDGEGSRRARVGHVERIGSVPLARIREWVGLAGVRTQPVIWMDTTDAVDAHDPPEWMAELVRLRDPHCVFPGCVRDSRSCDLDHIEAYIDGPNGPPGQTHPANLAPLCRGHHNAKTHLGWRYRRLPDGSYLWRAPDSEQYLVDTKGSVIYHGAA